MVENEESYRVYGPGETVPVPQVRAASPRAGSPEARHGYSPLDSPPPPITRLIGRRRVEVVRGGGR
jgi:hypothetical protein